ncbi:DMT family transporter [Piscinibacter koreensis]|uniref:DMT family transporter n=1 Tax=Piscinibacter koreensis TaxID=2742824 RepID=A0A7Y6NND0_9BURK|nr:DMT family transporter [Schlegelella koreensis]NUZ06254.1 DMT family transporter [Schlegelella koreensis]
MSRVAATAPIPWHAYAALAASMSIVGAYVGLAKALVAVFPVFLLAWIRFAIAGVAMLGWLRGGAGAPPLERRDRWLLFAESFFGNCLFSICMLYGVAMTSALAAGVTLAALPASVALMSWLLLRERIDARVLAAVACAVIGIALVALGTPPSEVAPARPLGYVLLVGALVCEALYVVIGKQLSGRVKPTRISALINAWGFALVTPLGVWQATRFDFGAVGVGSWALLAAYAIAASILTVWLWMTGLKHVPASSAGVFTVLLPLSAGAIGALVFGEPFGTTHAAALAFALVGIVLATRPVPPPRR